MRFLDDGRLELDANAIESLIRHAALTRTNSLLAGHEIRAENWARTRGRSCFPKFDSKSAKQLKLRTHGWRFCHNR